MATTCLGAEISYPLIGPRLQGLEGPLLGKRLRRSPFSVLSGENFQSCQIASKFYVHDKGMNEYVCVKFHGPRFTRGRDTIPPNRSAGSWDTRPFAGVAFTRIALLSALRPKFSKLSDRNQIFCVRSGHKRSPLYKISRL